MATDGDKSLKEQALAALTGFGGVAALVLGTLYLGGVLTKSRELAHAGLSVRDSLTLFPLEQVLRTGLTLVAPSLIVLTIWALGFGLSSLWEKRLALHAAAFGEEEKSRLPDSYWAEVANTNWGPVQREIREGLRRAKKDGNANDRVRQLRRRLRSFSGFVFFGLVVLVGIPIGTALYLPEGFAVGFAFVALWFLVRLKMAPIERQLVPFFVITVIFLIASALWYPRPLPMATLVTDNQGTVMGELVVYADSTWYLKAREGAVWAVAAEHVECSRIDTQEREETRLWERIFPPLEVPDPNRSPTLGCRVSQPQQEPETDPPTATFAPDVRFDFKKMMPRSRRRVRRIADAIRQRGQVAGLRIDGHADDRGRPLYNLRLSRRRSCHVARELRRLLADEVPPMQVRAFGEADPVAPNIHPDGSDDPSGRAENRRVEVIILSHEPTRRLTCRHAPRVPRRP